MFVPKYGQISEKLETLTSKVLELTYTSYSTEAISNAVGDDTGPYNWDEETRREIRWEIDGLVANLYELDKDDLDYILDQFEIVRSNDISEFGYYKSKEEIIKHSKKYSEETEKLELEENE